MEAIKGRIYRETRVGQAPLGKGNDIGHRVRGPIDQPNLQTVSFGRIQTVVKIFNIALSVSLT